MSSKKVKAKTFIEAANLIAEDTDGPNAAKYFNGISRPPACCNALVQVSGSIRYDEPHNIFFSHFFKPEPDPLVGSWENSFWWGSTFIKENQMARTLALLFAAEMVKDTRRRKYEKSISEPER